MLIAYLLICNQLLHHERKPWSNFSGTSGFETITNILPPKGYNWLETNWVLDKSCPWVHDKLDIGNEINAHYYYYYYYYCIYSYY
jgi:hypothetical protein